LVIKATILFSEQIAKQPFNSFLIKILVIQETGAQGGPGERLSILF